MSVLMTVVFFTVPLVVVFESVCLVLQSKRLKRIAADNDEIKRRLQRADLAALIAAKTNKSVNDVDMVDVDGFLGL